MQIGVTSKRNYVKYYLIFLCLIATRQRGFSTLMVYQVVLCIYSATHCEVP